MSISLGIRSRSKELEGARSWWIDAGELRLTALEDGKFLDMSEGHLFVMNPATGHIMIDGGFGTFCHSWPESRRAKGESLASFLLRLRFDYFMEKSALQPWREVDVPASIRAMKRDILSDRRSGHGRSKDEARRLWRDLDFTVNDDMTEGELVRELCDDGDLYDAFVADGGPALVRRDVATARRFWDETWTAFRDSVLRPMAEREKAGFEIAA